MANQPESLTAAELLALQELMGHSALLSGLRKIFAAEEQNRLYGMQSEALSMARPLEIVKYAAEARVLGEWEHTLKKGMMNLGARVR